MTKHIIVDLTEDQAQTLLRLLDNDKDYGDDLLGTKPDKVYNAYLTRIEKKLAKAKTSAT